MTTPGLRIDQISEAVSAVPGVVVTFLDTAPTSGYSTSSTSFADINAELAGSFTAPAAGDYFFIFTTAISASVDEDVGAQFQLLIDAGTGDEQAVGGTYPDWNILVSPAGSVYERAISTFTAYATLSAGVHTIKPQWKKTNGSTAYVDQGSPFVAKGFLVSGSGVGGLIADSKERTSQLVITGTASPDAKQLDSALSLSFNTIDNERVLIVFVGTASMYGSGVAVPRGYIFIDGEEKARVAEEIDVQYYSANLSMVYLTEPLSAGAHTAEFYFTKYDSGSPEWRLNDCHSQYLIFRGGQMPIKQNGVLVASTEQSLNFTGAGIDVTNNNGDIDISMVGPMGPTVDRKEELSTQTISAALDVGGKQELTALARTITTLNNENIELVFFGTARMPASGAANGYVWFEVDDVIVETHSGFYLPAVNYVENVNFTIRKTLLPGLHSIKCYAAKYTGSETNWQLYSIRSYIVQSRGGYSYPENIPVLEYNSASVVNVTAAPGCSTTLRAVLNNGQEYTYTGTLTVDLSVSGRGGLDTGSEASGTWYYVYLVPNVNGDALSVVCSASSPATGPTGFPVWKYVGPIRNDGSSNILPFVQVSESEFKYTTNQTVYSSGSAGYIEPEVAYATVSIAAFIPATANEICIKSYMETNAVSGELWYMNLSSDGANLFTNHALFSDSAQRQISELFLKIPISNTNLYRWRSRSTGSGDLYWTAIFAIGWRDGWLARNKQTEIITDSISESLIPDWTQSDHLYKWGNVAAYIAGKENKGGLPFQVNTYTHGVTAVNNAYRGGTLAQNGRIYFIPAFQAPETNWHYLNTKTGQVVAYAPGYTPGGDAYCGGVLAPSGRIYLIPSYQADAANWHYIDTKKNVIVEYAHGVTAVDGAYWGGILAPDGKIYLVPFGQANQTNWHYISSSGVVTAYAHGATVVQWGYGGGVLAPNGRIYLVPYGQSNQTNWHYIDTSTGNVEAYAHGATVAQYGYMGGVLSPDGTRIYLIPWAQSSSANWHYIDVASATVTAYAHGQSGIVANAYASGVLAPDGYIYMVPFSQSDQSSWHRIAGFTGEVEAYTPGVTIGANAYYGGVLGPDNRIYFIPSYQADETVWHFIEVNTNDGWNKNLCTSPLFNKF